MARAGNQSKKDAGGRCSSGALFKLKAFNADRGSRIDPAAPDRALLDQVAELDHSLIGELLHPLTAIGLGGVDVALGIGDDAVHGIELTGLPAAAAEPVQFLHGLAVEDMDVLIGAIGDVQELLLLIGREG